MGLNYELIGQSLDRLHRQHHNQVLSDPIQFPRQFSNPKDQEIIALISALYAFGNVKMIFNTLRNIFTFAGDRPYQKIISLKQSELKAYLFVQHRWISPTDTQSMLLLIQSLLKKHMTLEDSFMQFYQNHDETLETSISNWMKYLQTSLIELQKKPLTRGQKFLLSSPSGGSTSKRILMFFRWMVRSQEPDLGLWKKIKSSQLLMPLDAHLFRFSQYLGFTKTKQHGWKAVMEATAHFRKIDSMDPVRYDFALARLGILNLCVHKVQEKTCSPCLIRDHCTLFKRSRKAKSFDLHL